MKNILVRFVMDESGATVIEYGLIAFLISIGIIGALTVIGITLGGSMPLLALHSPLLAEVSVNAALPTLPVS
jgi:pilus assembly protein Flp/PilA